MRMVKLCSLFALPLCFAAGCGKIELVGGGGNDGGSNHDGGSNVDLVGSKIDMVGQPVAVAKATPVDQSTDVGAPVYLPLVGVGVRLDAAGSSDPKGMTLSYTWTVVSAPSGSAINTAALTNAATASASFIPDRGGDYQIQLAVTTTDSRISTTILTVTATTAPIFYDSVTVNAGVSAGMAAMVVRSDGQGMRQVGCTKLAGVNIGSSALLTGVSSLIHARVAEPKLNPTTGAIGPSRFLRSDFVTDADMRTTPFDWRFSILDEDGDCTTKPPRAIPQPVAQAPLVGIWSPDTTRFLYVTVDDIDGSKISASYAVAVDGSPPTVAPVTGLESFSLAPVEPAWVDDTTILFVAVTNAGVPSTYKIYKAKLNGAVASDVALWADCESISGTWGRLQGFEARGSVAYLGISLPEGAVSLRGRGWDIWKFEPGAGTSCSPVNLTASPEGGSARDFTVSPDGAYLAYSRNEVTVALDMTTDNNGPSATDIWIMSTSNPGSARKLVGQDGRVDVGPRFLAGGRQIVFYAGPSQDVLGELPADGGAVDFDWNGIAIVNLDGTNVRSLVGGTGTVTPNSNGPTNFSGPLLGANYSLLSVFGGCAVDPFAHPLSSVATGLLFAGAVVLGVRRRRKS